MIKYIVSLLLLVSSYYYLTVGVEYSLSSAFSKMYKAHQGVELLLNVLLFASFLCAILVLIFGYKMYFIQTGVVLLILNVIFLIPSVQKYILIYKPLTSETMSQLQDEANFNTAAIENIEMYEKKINYTKSAEEGVENILEIKHGTIGRFNDVKIGVNIVDEYVNLSLSTSATTPTGVKLSAGQSHTYEDYKIEVLEINQGSSLNNLYSLYLDIKSKLFGSGWRMTGQTNAFVKLRVSKVVDSNSADLYKQQPKDEVLATSKMYSIVLRLEDQSGIARL